jgi:hypothetical protein
MAVGTLQATLTEIHAMLAALTQTPELALGDDDAKRLAGALANVTRHYQLPTLSPERMALAMLVWTAGSIYFPKVRAIAQRKRSGDAVAGDATPSDPRPYAQQDAENVRAGPWFVAPAAG